MSEPRYGKAILGCRIVTVCSAVLSLIFIAILWSWADGNINLPDGADPAIRIIAAALTAGVFVPPWVIIGLKMKQKAQQTDNRIDDLERELARLKNK